MTIIINYQIWFLVLKIFNNHYFKKKVFTIIKSSKAFSETIWLRYHTYVSFYNLGSLHFFDRNEEEPSYASCKWENPPENGFHFLPCSPGLCWDKEGSPKRNGTLRFTRCNPHFVLIGGSERSSCLNGQWTSGGQKCIRKLRLITLHLAFIFLVRSITERGGLKWKYTLFNNSCSSKVY